MRNTIIITTVLAIALIASTAFAWGPGTGMRHNGYGMMNGIGMQSSPGDASFRNHDRYLQRQHAANPAERPNPDSGRFSQRNGSPAPHLNATNANWDCPGFNSEYRNGTGLHMNGWR